MTAHATSAPVFLAQTPLLVHGIFEEEKKKKHQLDHKTSGDVNSNSSLLSFWTLLINLHLIAHLDVAL